MASLPSWLSSFNTISSIKPTFFPSTNLNKPHPLKPHKLSFSLDPANAESSQPTSSNSPETTPEVEPGHIDPVKLALEKAKAYKKSVEMKKNLKIEKNPVKDGGVIDGNDGPGSGWGSDGAGGGTKEVPAAVEIAMEKAKEYKNKKGIVAGGTSAGESDTFSGLEGSIRGNSGSDEVEMKGKLSVSSIDFVGLNFADKKEGRGLPAGLAPIADPFPEGGLSDVEIIVGDSSNFGAVGQKPEQTQGDDSDIYKPKVSSWGVFPRPNDISKTFGGGRVIRPGEVLETEEEKAAKDARTRQLVGAYKTKIGMNIDPKLRSECEKVGVVHNIIQLTPNQGSGPAFFCTSLVDFRWCWLISIRTITVLHFMAGFLILWLTKPWSSETLKDGDSLMDVGKLKEALIYYEKVMDKLPFKSELHGLAALQWSICQDSLSRSQEAQIMYDKLQSHPTPKVSKKARQFLFSFQAMEIMKLTRNSPLKNTGYQNYFEAFIENKSDYMLKEAEGEVGTLSQTLPYIIFLISPIFIVLFIAIQKRI